MSGANADEPGKRQKYAIRPKPNLASRYLQEQEEAAAVEGAAAGGTTGAAAAGGGLGEEASRATSVAAASVDVGQVSAQGSATCMLTSTDSEMRS